MADQQIKSEISGNVWKILKVPGEAVAEEEALMILESMKMEIPVMAPRNGVVASIAVAEGDTVAEDQVVATLRG
jgi:acetyl-CoA carboxylase biotin carboxyl carrier protein